MLNSFDATTLSTINHVFSNYWKIDTVIRFISESNLIKGGLLILILWWAWFKKSNQRDNRISIISTLFASIIAIFIARALALLLPFRLRPIHQEGLDFIIPYSMDTTILDGWSSFPSDHAVLFYSLSMGVFYISKRLGVFALIYTTLFVALPRIYLGLHYPTDIICGAIIGIFIITVFQTADFKKRISTPILSFENKRPEIFYPILFLVSYQIIDLFDDFRAIALFIYEFPNYY